MSAISLPCTPKTASPTPRTSYVSDLFRPPKPQPQPPEAKCQESPRERAKAKAMVSKQESPRSSTAARFRANQAVQDLLTVFESVSNTIVEAGWFLPSGRLQALSCVLHLERKCYKALDTMTPPAPPTPSPSPPPDRGLERQLEVATRRVRELETELRSSPVPRLNLLNAKLSAELDDLRLELAHTRQTQVCEDLTEVLKEEQRRSSSLLAAAKLDIEVKEKEIVRQQFAAGRLQQVLTETTAELGAAKGLIKTLRETVAQLETRASCAEEANYQVTARIGMLREDMERFNSVIVAYEHNLEEIARLKERFGKLELQVITGSLGGRSEVEVRADLQDPIFALVGNSPLQEAHNKRLSLSAAKKEVELYAAGAPKIDPSAVAHVMAEEGKVLTLNADLNKDASRVDTSVYRYLRPNFASLVPEATQETFEQPFPNWLEVTVRGILDSKYYEHLLCTQDMGRLPSRLAEFTYAWLGQSVIDEGSRQVRSLIWWKKEAADQSRTKFLLALSSEQSRSSWEVHTFKEFLSEELAVDELAFYLHCRCMLFEGPQLATPVGRMNAVHYLSLDACNEVLDEVLVRLPASERTDIKTALAAKARKKANALHVDSAFALRVLLEYYRREKKCKFLAVAQLFAAARTEGVGFKRTVGFREFRSICHRLNQEFSELEVARLYRDTWTAGNGTINAETFFLVLNESPSLFHCLRMPGLWKQPVLTESGEVDAGANSFSQCIARVVADWKQMFRMLEMARDCVTSMGCPELSFQMSRLEATFNVANGTPPETFNGRNLMELYKRFWVCLSQVSVVYLEANAWVMSSTDDLEYLDTSLHQMIELRAGTSTFLETLRSQRLRRLSQKIAAQKIQRNWKGRLRRHMNVFSGVIKTVGKFKRLLRK